MSTCRLSTKNPSNDFSWSYDDVSGLRKLINLNSSHHQLSRLLKACLDHRLHVAEHTSYLSFPLFACWYPATQVAAILPFWRSS